MSPQKLFSEVLFFCHVGIIIFALGVGLFVPIWLWAVMAIGHRLQAVMFGGCILSKLERLSGSFNHQTDFIQHVVKRFTGREISPKQSKQIDYCLLAISFGLVGSKTLIAGEILSVPQLLLIMLSAAGLALTVYMSLKQRKPRPMICGLGGGCNTIMNSSYTTIGPFKLTALGVAFYSMCLLLSLGSILEPLSLLALALVALAGVAVSFVLVFLQAFVIKSWCRLCMTSAALTVSIVALAPKLI